VLLQDAAHVVVDIHVSTPLDIQGPTPSAPLAGTAAESRGGGGAAEGVVVGGGAAAAAAAAAPDGATSQDAAQAGQAADASPGGGCSEAREQGAADAASWRRAGVACVLGNGDLGASVDAALSQTHLGLAQSVTISLSAGAARRGSALAPGTSSSLKP